MNSLGFTRSDIVEIALPENCALMDSDGRTIALQRIGDGKALFLAEDIPSKGYKAYSLVEGACLSERTKGCV